MATYPVFYKAEKPGFPSQSLEKSGRWVGVAENQGDVLTWLILDDETKQVVTRSMVWSQDSKNLNLRDLGNVALDRGENVSGPISY